jgi:CheY-like chemotaxis protein
MLLKLYLHLDKEYWGTPSASIKAYDRSQCRTGRIIINNHNQRLKQNEKKRILVVDDEPDVTLTLKLALEGTGLFDVDTFNDPELALSNFKRGLYTLLLFDFEMLKMTSYGLYDEIKMIDDNLRYVLSLLPRVHIALRSILILFKTYL